MNTQKTNPWKNIESVIASEVITDFDTYKNHPTLLKIYDGYAPSEMQRHLRISKPHFSKCFVVNVDPAKNYGMAQKLYIVINSPESVGLQFVREVSAGSSMTSDPFTYVSTHDGGFDILHDIRIPKTPENRKRLASQNATVM